MSRKLIKTFIILSICSFLFLSACTSSDLISMDSPKAIDGELDLTGWDWEKDGILSLDGQWEFYWQALFTPEDFNASYTPPEKELIMLPRAWNKLVIDEGELSGDGYATYRLVIHHPEDEILGIKVPRIFTSYYLWANGELIASAGKVDIDRTQMVPQYLPQVKYITPETDSIELVLQVANFRHRSGGLLESIQLGTASQISEMRMRNLALELFLFGSLFIIGFYHLALFIFRTKDKSTLYFGIYSLLLSTRTLLVGEIFFIHIFPSFNWEIAHKMQTLAYYLGLPLLYLFLDATFPNDIPKKSNSFIQIVASGFALLVLLTPVRVFSQFNPLYQIFSIYGFAYTIYIIVRVCNRKREGSYLIGIGVIFLILFTLNDIIFLSILLADADNHFLRNYITRGNLSSWGLLIFVFTQSLVVAKKFSKSFSNVELLSMQLQQVNVSLEEKVRERTHALETSREELKEAYQAVSRSEKSLKDLAQNVSHDLRTPLSAIKGYVNAILDGVVKEPQQQKKYLKRVTDKVNHLNHMVEELLDLSQLQSRQLKLMFTEVPVKLLVENIKERYSLDMMNEHVQFNVNDPPNWQNTNDAGMSLHVIVDWEKLERIFTNLLTNALKHTSDGDTIQISFDFTNEQRDLIVKVSDTGTGIPKEDLPHIFDRFYKVSKARQTNSSGLGLAIVKEIVDYHGGKVWVESKVDKGSDFFFTLPIYRMKLDSEEIAVSLEL
ncbi:His Kinase A (phospho-acceptor) domain-containing protein [Natronincola peptidivorans]|uniref:histidine kinase n=1 Tax=Natronincola peptidivorans TaxID=426128 RepID=A0A1I0CEB0_9FIRM|nr:sensor histidine kinase [Natronincola peptidivorans]SET17923.1 His Kinase A (phospho-acceptor) domain-containing protein [Natronincola peptidivorans]